MKLCHTSQKPPIGSAQERMDNPLSTKALSTGAMRPRPCCFLSYDRASAWYIGSIPD